MKQTAPLSWKMATLPVDHTVDTIVAEVLNTLRSSIRDGRARYGRRGRHLVATVHRPISGRALRAFERGEAASVGESVYRKGARGRFRRAVRKSVEKEVRSALSAEGYRSVVASMNTNPGSGFAVTVELRWGAAA